MDSRLLNLRLQAEHRTVQPDHDLMLWAHDEIERLRAALQDARAFVNDWGPEETPMMCAMSNKMLERIDRVLANGTQ